ncbi:MAG: ATP-binding protein, partial [Alkalispirochaeta sp.]
QLRLQGVIAQVSSTLARFGPDSCRSVIDDALARIGEFFSIGRCALLRFSDDYRRVDCTNEWCAPGVSSSKEKYTDYPIGDMPWWSQMIRRGEMVQIPDVDALPPEASREAEDLRSREVKSCLCIPVRTGSGELTGFVGFDATRHPYAWTSDQIQMLTVVVEAIAGALDRAETTQKLRERESQLRRILDSASDVVWSVNYPGMTPIFLSPSIEQLYGYPVSAFENDPTLWKKVVHPDDVHTIADVKEQLERTGTGVRECRIICPDGTVKWISDRSHFVYDETGSPVRIDGIATDISERKRNEEQIRYQNAFQEMTADLATRFVGANSSNIDALLGETLERIGTFFAVDRCSIIRSSSDLTSATISHEWYRDPDLRIADSPVQNYPIERTGWLRQKILTERTAVHIPDTAELPEEANTERRLLDSLGIRSALMVPIYTVRRVFGFLGIYTIDSFMEWTDGQAKGVSVISQILAHAFASIEAEAELIAMKEEADASKDAAESANRAKSDFLSSMSHELRTPLNAVLGYAQFLQSEETLTREQTEMAREIFRAGQHLVELVDEVLDLSRIESGRIDLTMEPVSCEAVLLHAQTLIQPLARSYGVTIEPFNGAPYTVHTDKTRFKQVVINLLSNAIKYNRPDGRVSISVTATAETVSIAVADTGAGIPEDRLDELFTQFNRLGRERGDIDGTGIGLALTHRLLDLMGGTVSVESEVGVGSTFTITLPVARRGHSTSREPAEDTEILRGPSSDANETDLPVPSTDDDEAAVGAKPVVLYIDDNEPSIRLLTRIFKHRPSLTLVTASSGTTGLALAERHHPVCVLVDINLPDISGYEVLRHITSKEWGKATPVIAVTANAMNDAVADGTDAGFEGYVTKPIDIREFLMFLDRIVPGAAE